MKWRWFAWLPWLLALVWLGFRYSAGVITQFDFEKGRNAGVLANLLAVLLVIFITLIHRHRTGQSQGSTFFQDVRTTAATGVKYVIGVLLAMGLYYAVFSDEIQKKRMADHAVNASLLDTPEKLAAVKESNEMLRTLSVEQILKSANDRTDLMLGTGFVLSSSFISLFFTTLLYGVLGTFIFRQFIRAK